MPPVHHDQTLRGDTRLLPALMGQPILDIDDKSDDADFICCTLEFDNEIDHLSHMINHIAENFILLQRVKCDYCDYSFNDHYALKRHLPKHGHGLGFNCYYCQQHIPEWRQLVQHVMYQHNYQIKYGNKSNQYKQQNKFKRGSPKRNGNRFNKQFKYKANKKYNWASNNKTEGKYKDFVRNIKTEPNVKSDPLSCASVGSVPIFFNPRIVIKTEPTFIKTEPIDNY